MSPELEHRPVMLEEVLDVMRLVPPGLVVDATVGAGGHASALLGGLGQVELVGLDRDDDALASARSALSGHGTRATLVRARFDEIRSVVLSLGRTEVSGVLFDLGVSSMQLDRAGRGFSYRHDGPLDMRMDRRQALDASVVVNSYSQADLAALIRIGGDERFAGRIAAALVAARPILTTAALADVVRDAIPAPARRHGGHPAKRTFQALRIEVNAELDVLGPALDDAFELLAPGGRCAVLAYHSGEDRIVKHRFQRATVSACECPHGLPCACGLPEPRHRLLWRGARKPTPAEIASNPRAESARLRSLERLAA